MQIIAVLTAILFASSAYAKYPFDDDHTYTVICSDHIKLSSIYGEQIVPSDTRIVINDLRGELMLFCSLSNVTIIRETNDDGN